MNDRDIEKIGEEGAEPWQFKRVQCEHCKGTGKCACYNCFYEVNDDDLEQYNEYVKENPDLKFECSKCDGFGFLLLYEDGTLVVPRVRK